MCDAVIFLDLDDFAAQYPQQSSWEGNVIKAPTFSHLLNTRFGWGSVDIFIDVDKGAIEQAQVFTDSVNPTSLQKLAEMLVGCACRSEALAARCGYLNGNYGDG